MRLLLKIWLLAALFVILMWSHSRAQQAFVPFTIDQQKYQQIDEAIGKISMPREAHVTWAQIWTNLERQAQEGAAHKNVPPPEPPPK